MIRELVVEGQSELLVIYTTLPRVGTDVRENVSRDEVEKYVGGLPDMIQGRVLILLTIKESSPAMNVGIKGTTYVIARSWNHGNQAGGAEACGMVYALGGRETGQDIDDIEDDINA
ncbi:hypothetical protein Tco_0247090 [Tanacetum coccineum]